MGHRRWRCTDESGTAQYRLSVVADGPSRRDLRLLEQHQPSIRGDRRQRRSRDPLQVGRAGDFEGYCLDESRTAVAWVSVVGDSGATVSLDCWQVQDPGRRVATGPWD